MHSSRELDDGFSIGEPLLTGISAYGDEHGGDTDYGREVSFRSMRKSAEISSTGSEPIEEHGEAANLERDVSQKDKHNIPGEYKSGVK